MSPSFAANWNETVLIQATCMRRQGPLAYSGLLTLTDQRLSFSPTGRLDRIVGVRELEVPISLITHAEIVGIEKNLVVEFEERTARFAGQGAKRVFSRLDALLHENKPSTPIEFQPGERVLVQGVATSYVNGLIATRGEVVLTDKRIRFLTGGGLETLIWTFPELDHPLEAITRAELSGVRKLLEVWIDGERRIFGGTVVPKLFNSLQALGIQSGPGEEAYYRPDGVFRGYPASLFRGPLAHPGELVVSESRVSFTPSGRLDSMVGARASHINLVDVIHIEVVDSRRLAIQSRSERLLFDIAKPLDRLKELLPMIRDALTGQLDDLQRDGLDGFDELFQEWVPVLNIGTTEPVVLTGPAMQWVKASSGARGWLALTDRRLLFLPSGGPNGEHAPLAIELSVLQQGESLNPDDIFVEYEDQAFHFSPLTGAGFIDAFWMLSEPIITEEIEIEEVNRRLAEAPSEAPIELAPSAEARNDDHTINRAVGSLLSLSISRNKSSILLLTPAFTVRAQEGLGILLTQAPGLRFKRGELLEIGFAQPEGTYLFETIVHRMAPVPANLQPTYPEAIGLLVVEMPQDLQFNNRRGEFRVASTTPTGVIVRFLEEIPGVADEQVTGLLSNLSMGGCLIETRGFIPDGAQAAITLDFEPKPIEVQAVCVRADPPEDIRGSWNFGMRFVHLPETVYARINQEIVRRQREELAKKALDKEG